MTRRLAAGLAVALVLAARGAAQREPIEAYPDWPSARAGERLALHVSSRAPRLDLAVFREGEPDAPRWEAHDVAASVQAVPAGAPGVDTGWPVTCEIPLDAAWPSGPWRVRLSARGDVCEVPFLLRPAAPHAGILVLAPMCTVQAYNTWGGASLYRGPDRPPVPVVTLYRPLAPSDPYGRHAAAPLDGWLRARGLSAEWAADVDLVRDPHLLDGCDLLVLAGHHEYWSAEMRAAVDAFVGDGGRLLILGANTCYWQIRFEQDGTAIRCYKRADRDPLLASGHAEDLARITSTWLAAPVLDSQERSLGLAWQHAGSTAPLIAGSDWHVWSVGAGPDRYAFDQGFGIWRVATPLQADLAPLGLLRSAPFGAAAAAAGAQLFGACGGEVDGALTEELGGVRPASTALGAPRNLLVLADAPAEEGFAAIASFERVGEVLWCSSERLVPSLVAEPGVPDLSRFIEGAVRRLSRPRRNLLAHGGFEVWDGDVPQGWEVTGEARRAAPGVAQLGAGALELPAGEGAVRQSITLGGAGPARVLLLAHVGSDTPAVRLRQGTGVTVQARSVSTSDDVLAAVVDLPDRQAPVTIELAAARGVPTIVDEVELLDLDALGSEWLDLHPSTDATQLVSDPLPGGGRVLVFVDVPDMLSVRISDAASGALLVEAGHLPGFPHEAKPMALSLGGRGATVRLDVKVTGDDEEPRLGPGIRVLPLRVPASAPPARPRDGGFESDDTGHWTRSGGGELRRTAEASLTGSWGLHVEADGQPVTLSQSLGATPGPLVLTLWVRGEGQVAAALVRGMLGGSALCAAKPEWHALRVSTGIPPGEDPLLVRLSIAPGSRVDIDAITVADPSDLLVDDLYPNGGFEIVPTAAELARGADWSARPPRWASLAGPPPRLDAAQAYDGSHALRLQPGARAATHLGWPLAAGAAAVVGVHVRADAPDTVTLRLLAGPAGSEAPAELVSWTGGTPGAWVPALLDVPPGLVQGLPPDAFLIVETGAGGAWLDDLTFAAADSH